MTSEDYMGTYEWDHEIDIIIQDMREKLYDLKDRFVTEGVPTSERQNSYPAKCLDNIEELRGGIDALYPLEKEITYE